MGGDVLYAPRDGGSWDVDTVDAGALKLAVGAYASLALDVSDQPHISYVRANDLNGNVTLNYAYLSGPLWITETADSNAVLKSLDLDPEGHPHIDFASGEEFGSSHLGLAWHDGQYWHVEMVYPVDGTYVSLSVDGDGYNHITYYARGREIKVAHEDADGRLSPWKMLLRR